MKMTVKQLAQHLDAELFGCGSAIINAVGAVKLAGSNEVTFITDKKYIPAIGESDAAAVIVNSEIKELDKPQLVVPDVNAALIKALTVFAPTLKPAPLGVDKTAKVAENVKIGVRASVGPGAVIEDNAVIGDDCVIGSGCKIGQNSILGKNCRLDPNVVIYHNCTLGNNVIIQANTSIGATGFGYAFIDNAHRLIPHNGGVVIEDFVEIGANSSVDRAKFGQTLIGAGTKIDNLVQIAHNVIIGKCCLIAALVGIAGSVRIGNGVVIAGQVGITDNVQIEDHVIIAARAVVTSKAKAGQVLLGFPAADRKETLKVMALTRRLPNFFDQLKNLTARVKELEAAENNKK